MAPEITGPGDGEDCGCGNVTNAQGARVAAILALPALPTHDELRARQARLAVHLQ